MKQNSLYIVLYQVYFAINGGAMVFSDPFRGTKRQTWCVHNSPGTRENAARIDDRYAKKQYHRAFKANATTPVPDSTVVVPYDSRLVPYGTASVPYDSRPVSYGTASVPYDSRSVPYGTASVPYASRPVPYGAASVSDNSVLVAGILIPMRYCKNNFNTI